MQKSKFSENRKRKAQGTSQAVSKPRDIRIKYQAQSIKLDAHLISKTEAKRLVSWCGRVLKFKARKK
jgi:hypothetical protein